MQAFALDRRYRAIFLAGASFTLLANDADAAAALRCMYAHLEPSGAVLIPIDADDEASLRRSIGRHREVTTPAGERLRFGMIGLDTSDGGRNRLHRVRYERIPAGGAPVVLERTWVRRTWTPAQLDPLLRDAGFATPRFRLVEGGEASADAASFVALARRAPDSPARRASERRVTSRRCARSSKSALAFVSIAPPYHAGSV
jgi:hypothetical protein